MTPALQRAIQAIEPMLQPAEAHRPFSLLPSYVPPPSPEAIVRKVLEAVRDMDDDMQDAPDDAFHAEFAKQAKKSRELHGTVGLASGPFTKAVWRAVIDQLLS